MGQDAFVDVAYRGLEVGRRLRLHDVGPRTAHLEHGTPMPVGCELAMRTDAGLTIRVMVIRVHEQVAGAELTPGMRVEAVDLEGAAAGWWEALVTREDPEIPELPVAPVVPMPRGDEQIAEAPEPEETEVVPQPRAHDTTVMNVPELAAVLAAAEAMEEGEGQGSGNGATGKRDLAAAPQAGRTMVMSAAEIEAITGEIPVDDEHEGDEGTETATDPSARTDGGNGEPGANGDELRGKSRGKSRGKRGRRR
jgi:hypothetical protein